MLGTCSLHPGLSSKWITQSASQLSANLEQRKTRPSIEPSGLLLARGGLHGIEVLSPVNRFDWSTPIHPVSTCQMLLISQETPRRQKPTHFLKEAVVLSGQNMRWWACFVCMLFMHALCIPRFLERTSISEGTCWYIDSMPTTSCNSKTESEKAPCATANALCYARPDKNTGPEHQNSRLGDWPLSAPAPATEGNLVAFPPILAGPLSHIKHRLGAKLHSRWEAISDPFALQSGDTPVAPATCQTTAAPRPPAASSLATCLLDFLKILARAFSREHCSTHPPDPNCSVLGLCQHLGRRSHGREVASYGGQPHLSVVEALLASLPSF